MSGIILPDDWRATIYHVTPVTPEPRLRALAGRHFMVSHYRPDHLALTLSLAAGVAFDNGAFSYFTEWSRLKKKEAAEKASARDLARIAWLERPRDWKLFYDWLDPILFAPGRWAVIPDVIREGGQAQDALIKQWPYGHRGSPVWHTGEPIDRLLHLVDAWPRVCIGSTDEHWQVGGKAWLARMRKVWEILGRRRCLPVIHMLRGTDVADLFPFHSADSSSLGQNGHRYKMPLFQGTNDEFSGVIAYAERLEGMRT